jgi:hypothetical protein
MQESKDYEKVCSKCGKGDRYKILGKQTEGIRIKTKDVDCTLKKVAS